MLHCFSKISKSISVQYLSPFLSQTDIMFSLFDTLLFVFLFSISLNLHNIYLINPRTSIKLYLSIRATSHQCSSQEWWLHSQLQYSLVKTTHLGKTYSQNVNTNNNKDRAVTRLKYFSQKRCKSLNCTNPSKPLVSAPFRTESDISVTAAKTMLEPAVLNCKATIKLASQVQLQYLRNWKYIKLTVFPRSPK